MESVFILIKPDGVKRKLVGELISRFENKNFNLMEMKLIEPTREQAEQHYIEHEDKDFYNDLVEFTCSGKIIVMLWSVDDPTCDIVGIARSMIGDSSPNKRIPGTIRGDFAFSRRENCIHVSDCNAVVQREYNIWFL